MFGCNLNNLQCVLKTEDYILFVGMKSVFEAEMTSNHSGRQGFLLCFG